MKYKEVSWYSDRLNREMRVKIYVHYGTAFIFRSRIAFAIGQPAISNALFLD